MAELNIFDNYTTPIYIVGVGSEVCFFQPESHLLSTLPTPTLPFALIPKQIYRFHRIKREISEYSKCEWDLIMKQSPLYAFTRYGLSLILLASRVRDYEQYSAIVKSLDPFVITTSMREQYLKELELRAESGESFTVRVDGKRGNSRACTVFCTPTSNMPITLKVGSRLEMHLDTDRVPVVTRILAKHLDAFRKGIFDDKESDHIKVLFAEEGSWVHSPVDRSGLPINAATRNLNPEQREFLARYLTNSGSPIVAGESPPGSGKTTLGVALVESYQQQGTQVVTSTANEPVYNFVEKFAMVGSKRVVHLISPTRELTHPTPYSVMLGEHGGEHASFGQLREEFISSDKKSRRRITRDLVRLRTKTIKQSTLEPEVVAGTIDAILSKYEAPGSDYIKQALGSVTRINIEESSQVPIAYLIALFLTFPRAKFALTGDSKQLPPFRYTMGDLVSEFAARSALDCVRASRNVPVIKFRSVYRCPPSMIKHLQYFYPDVELVSMKKESEIYPLECFTRDRKSRCALFMVEGKTKKSGNSKSNEKELQALLKIVEQLKAEGHGADEVMIISYYEAQRTAAKRALPAYEVLTVEKAHPGYEVHTVDSAQGREKAIVIVLTTRDSVPGDAGFLVCPKRACVALSRAQEALIVLAHPSLLTAEPFSVVLSKEFFTHIPHDQICMMLGSFP